MTCKTVKQETYEVLDSIDRMTRRIRAGLEDIDVDNESEEYLICSDISINVLGILVMS